MKNILKHKLILFFLFIITIIPILTILNGNANISNIENRTLAELPTFNSEKLLTGEYFNEWENYISDHIVCRDHFIKIYTKMNMNLLKKKNINNIVLGKDNTLLPYYTEELDQTLEDNLLNLPNMLDSLNELNKFIENNNGKFLFVGLPGQSSFFHSRYPHYFENKKSYFQNNERQMFQGLENRKIDFINMNQVFLNDYNENYYLKTDHHFSFEGSFKTYENIIKKLHMNPLRKDEFNIITLDNPILGSRNRQIYFLQETDEQISIAYPKDEIDYIKTTNGQLDQRLYYTSEDPNERPSYGIYMNGDHGEIIIDTNRPDLPNLLIFGDSFTNALEPLLYYHFNQTRILDLRHYTNMNLYEYIEIHKPDNIIMIRDDLNYGNPEGNGKFK